MFPWNGIVEFVAVAKHASFTHAANQLGISTAQVSRQVGLLENRLQTKLFYRTTRKVSLTEEGAIYFRHCQQVLDNLEEAERSISSLQNTPQGLIRMTAPVTYGEQFIMPIVLEFMEKYPQVEVICELTNKQLDLVDGSYDLAIRLGHLADSSLVAKRLASRRQFVCASPKYIQLQGAPQTLADLSQHHCLVGTKNHWHFEHNGRETLIRVNGRLQCSSGITLLNAAISGLGIVQLPDYYVNTAIKEGGLQELLPSFQPAPEGIWAIYSYNRHLSPKISLLIKLLAEKLVD
ncbi:LysR substrate-binding domain-containing protein [Shewanella gaetbuli]|uniref:LysR substrate-binding domain-containing protein n=1 Tax=Shewanella gaetbuli TaxID=220752 RepID=A0A9X2CMM8_9GAMM|nr:LysR substrate-binding domain-containing protein [Shewanella gaetbuli]MCL1143840.1 LysR substrate-binding domain-containing protein [Shewanella gaetbuli]